jgi:hypothetical protein
MEATCYNEQTKQAGLFFLLLNLLIVFLTTLYKFIINFTFTSFIAGYILQPFIKKETIVKYGNYVYDKCNKYFSFLYEKIPLQYKKQYVKEEDLKQPSDKSEQFEMKEISNESEESSKEE